MLNRRPVQGGTSILTWRTVQVHRRTYRPQPAVGQAAFAYTQLYSLCVRSFVLVCKCPPVGCTLFKETHKSNDGGGWVGGWREPVHTLESAWLWKYTARVRGAVVVGGPPDSPRLIRQQNGRGRDTITVVLTTVVVVLVRRLIELCRHRPSTYCRSRLFYIICFSVRVLSTIWYYFSIN